MFGIPDVRIGSILQQKADQVLVGRLCCKVHGGVAVFSAGSVDISSSMQESLNVSEVTILL